jgi:predicted O-methyltransferase YrrM
MKSNEIPQANSFQQFLKGTKIKILRMLGFSLNHPYMKEREIDIFLEILHKSKPAQCLEWGSGFSTLYFPIHLSDSAQWLSIEHHEEWHSKVKSMNTNPKVRIELVKANIENPQKESGSDFKNYVAFPETLPSFDLILVDGVARNACAKASLKYLKEDGLLIIHDINRKKYQEALKDYPYFAILEDFRKTSGGMGFASKSKPIDQYFDIQKHWEIWQTHTYNTNIFKFKYLVGKKSKQANLVIHNP